MAAESRPLAEPARPLPRDPPTTELAPGRALVRIYDPRSPVPGAPAPTATTPRTYGPHVAGRFDHHPGPARRAHEDAAVWYAALDLATAVAEAFGNDGIVDTTLARRVARLRLLRPLRLLDLRGAGPTFFRGKRSTPAARTTQRDVVLDHRIATSTDYEWTQRWARAFHADYPRLVGILWPSRFTEAPAVVLNERGFAGAPTLEVVEDRALADASLQADLRAACARARLPYTPLG